MQAPDIIAVAERTGRPVEEVAARVPRARPRGSTSSGCSARSTSCRSRRARSAGRCRRCARTASTRSPSWRARALLEAPAGQDAAEAVDGLPRGARGALPPARRGDRLAHRRGHRRPARADARRPRGACARRLMAQLVLGPLLRYVGDGRGDDLGRDGRGRARSRCWAAASATFRVAGHHYALVHCTGLEPGSTTPYEVRLDGEQVWPEAGIGVSAERRPHARRRRRRSGSRGAPAASARRTSRRTRCARTSIPTGARSTRCACSPTTCAGTTRTSGRTRSCCSATRSTPTRSRPAVREFIRARRDPEVPPGETVANFEEYTRLYRESWSEPHIRWLLSTVPSAMIFDDHDVHDDWNTSQTWVDDMRATGLVGRAHRRRLLDLLALPAHGQPLAASTWPRTRSTRGCARPRTAGRSCASSPSAPTARCRARAGATAATSAARGWS